MIKSKLYKCYNCGSIFVTTDMSHCPKCIKCGQMMQELQEDFDLSEIVEEDVNEQQPKEKEKFPRI